MVTYYATKNAVRKIKLINIAILACLHSSNIYIIDRLSISDCLRSQKKRTSLWSCQSTPHMMMLLRMLLIDLVWTILLKFGLHNTTRFLTNPNLTTSNTEVLITSPTCYIIIIRCVTYYIMRYWTSLCLNWKV
uniref:Uncharacterized protein n=1 Tax=Arundo donax TaxID=35708 RepID=A0A0A9DSK9_ARUDO